MILQSSAQTWTSASIDYSPPQHSPPLSTTSEISKSSISHFSLRTPLLNLFAHKGGKMPEIMLGAHTVKSHGIKVARVHMYDWLILILLMGIQLTLHFIEPFHRFVGKDMMSDLMYPFKDNTVPVWSVPMYSILLPFAIFVLYYIYRKDVYDLHHATLGILFSAFITGVLTDSIKLAVGRPRPNFFWRCFPDGKAVFDRVTGDVICHGIESDIKEGYKSFPSGHTSWSFAGLTFLALYLAGKIRVFDRRGHVAKQCIVFIPMLGAALVGISRVDDYWHHWQDVFAGAFLGSTVAFLCYLHFFPYPHDDNGWAPHAYFLMLAERSNNQSSTNRENSLRVRPDNGILYLHSVSIKEENQDGDSQDSSDSILEAIETGRQR